MKRTEVRTWGRTRPDLWEVRGIREREDDYRLTGKTVMKILLHARYGSIGEVVEDDVETSEWWKKQLGKTFHFDDVFIFEAGKEEPFGTLLYDLSKLKAIMETN
jgi:hypothetical protein